MYRLKARIASGAMSEVYEASALDVDRRLAIKRLIGSQGEEDEARQARFLREAAVIATLDHPNVVEIVDLGEYRGDLLLVMEMLDGLSLEEMLSVKKRGLPVDLACGIAGQLARGLAHAHERSLEDGTSLGIVHRNVCPANVFVTEDGIPKLLDFSAATLEGHAVTMPGTAQGRSRYPSPEQARGEKVDERTDIFGLGALLFELVCGKPLLSEYDDEKLLNKLQSGLHFDVKNRLEGIDADLIEIIERATQPSPDDRFGTANQFERRLDRFRAARGMRIDKRALAALVAKLSPRVTEKRKPRSQKGDLSKVVVKFRADESISGREPLERNDTPPAPPPQPRPKKKRGKKGKMKRLERKPNPKLDRPPSLGRPKHAIPQRGLSVITGAFTGDRAGLWIIVLGVVCIVAVIGLFVALS